MDVRLSHVIVVGVGVVTAVLVVVVGVGVASAVLRIAVGVGVVRLVSVVGGIRVVRVGILSSHNLLLGPLLGLLARGDGHGACHDELK